MKKIELKKKIAENKEDIRRFASGAVGSIAGYFAEVKLEELYKPETLLAQVGVKVAAGIAGGITAKVADEGFKLIDETGKKIVVKIQEKRKGIHYAEYEVVNEATA